jgi:sugar/nucleoside kinase (ribokinase family)
MAHQWKFDVILVGHFSKDKEIIEGRERDLLGGAVYYAACPLKIIGVKIAVVTRLAKEDFSKLTVFKEADIPVFTTEALQTTKIKNVYLTKDQEKRQCYLMGFAGSFAEEDFPDIDAQVIYIGALTKGEISLEMIKKLSDKADLSLDAGGFVRVREGNQLVMQDWDEKGTALPYIKYLKADAAEAEVLTGTPNLREAAEILAGMGPSEILITHSNGALLLAKGRFYEASFIPRSLEGRTGRGDTCMSTYIGKRLNSTPYEALYFAAALTTLKLEKKGPFKGDLQDVRDLLDSSKFAKIGDIQ